MARGTQRAFLPHDLNVQMPSTEEHPGGRVVTLRQGYNEVDAEMAGHPIVRRMLVTENETLEGQAAVAEAAQRRDEKIAQAHTEFHQECVKIEDEWRGKREKRVADWTQRRDQAKESSTAFDEPHPDEETQRAAALTGEPHVYPAAGFVTKEGDPKASDAPAPQRRTPDKKAD